MFLKDFEQKLIFLELLTYLGFALGLNSQRLSLNRVFITYAFLSLIVFLAYYFNLLPFYSLQSFVLENQEISGIADGFPALLSNPSPMCLLFLIGLSQLKNYKEILLYSLLCLPLILQSTSTIGILFYLIAFCLSFTKYTNFKKLKICFLFLLLGLIILPKKIAFRPFETRLLLYKEAFLNLNFIGHGASGFQRQSGLMFAQNASLIKLSRNQFHPHNDLLWQFYAFGFLGFCLRLFLMLYILINLLRQKDSFPLILAWLQVQFTPDLLSFPCGFILMFLSAQSNKARLNKAFNFFSLLLYLPITLLLYAQIWSYRLKQDIGIISLKRPQYFRSINQDYNYLIYLIRQNKLDLALKESYILESKAHSFYELPYLMGIIYYQKGDLVMAKACFKKMLTLQPKHVYSLEILADIEK